MEIDSEMREALDRAFAERPQWLSDLHRALYIRGFSHDSTATAMAAVAPHILAAEERGRREAARMAREAASAAQDTTNALGPNYNTVNALLRLADRIDPDKDNQ